MFIAPKARGSCRTCHFMPIEDWSAFCPSRAGNCYCFETDCVRKPDKYATPEFSTFWLSTLRSDVWKRKRWPGNDFLLFQLVAHDGMESHSYATKRIFAKEYGLARLWVLCNGWILRLFSPRWGGVNSRSDMLETGSCAFSRSGKLSVKYSARASHPFAFLQFFDSWVILKIRCGDVSLG